MMSSFTKVSPFEGKTGAFLETWDEWLDAWNRAKTDVELKSLLRVGYAMRKEKDQGFEHGVGYLNDPPIGYHRDHFYLMCADIQTYQTVEFSHRFLQHKNGVRAYAYQQLVLNYFKRLDAGSINRFVLPQNKEQLQQLQDLLTFFGCVGNLSIGDSLKEHHFRSFKCFVLLFVESSWDTVFSSTKIEESGYTGKAHVLLQQNKLVLLQLLDSIKELEFVTRQPFHNEVLKYVEDRMYNKSSDYDVGIVLDSFYDRLYILLRNNRKFSNV